MNEKLFRKQSLDRVSSPEQLDSYIRVSNPGVWMLLAAIIVLLIGVCVWGFLGRLDTTLPAVAMAKSGRTLVFVKEEDLGEISLGMTIQVDDREVTITSVSPEPMTVDEQFTEYARHLGGLQLGQWVYALTVSGTLPDGTYSARIVTESVAPISFVIN